MSNFRMFNISEKLVSKCVRECVHACMHVRMHGYFKHNYLAVLYCYCYKIIHRKIKPFLNRAWRGTGEMLCG